MVSHTCNLEEGPGMSSDAGAVFLLTQLAAMEERCRSEAELQIRSLEAGLESRFALMQEEVRDSITSRNTAVLQETRDVVSEARQELEVTLRAALADITGLFLDEVTGLFEAGRITAAATTCDAALKALRSGMEVLSLASENRGLLTQAVEQSFVSNLMSLESTNSARIEKLESVMMTSAGKVAPEEPTSSDHGNLDSIRASRRGETEPSNDASEIVDDDVGFDRTLRFANQELWSLRPEHQSPLSTSTLLASKFSTVSRKVHLPTGPLADSDCISSYFFPAHRAEMSQSPRSPPIMPQFSCSHVHWQSLATPQNRSASASPVNSTRRGCSRKWTGGPRSAVMFGQGNCFRARAHSVVSQRNSITSCCSSVHAPPGSSPASPLPKTLRRSSTPHNRRDTISMSCLQRENFHCANVGEEGLCDRIAPKRNKK